MARTPERVITPDDASQAPTKIRELLAPARGTAFARYRRLTYPTSSLWQFWTFELATMLLLPMPGGLGLSLRRALLKPFFGSFGRNVIIGRNCVFRNPQRIFIADSVVIDDNCLIDARGAADGGLRLEEGVLVSRGVHIKSKGGAIRIGCGVNIGDYTQIVSQSGIHIGDGAAIAGACQIMGGTFSLSEFNRPAPERTSTTAGPITIGSGVWLATAVLVMDAAHIGNDSIVSAGSVVTGRLPARCVAQGNPARKVFDIR